MKDTDSIGTDSLKVYAKKNKGNKTAMQKRNNY